MKFIESVKEFLIEYAKFFSGRASVREYWHWWSILGIINIILSVIENPILYFNHLLYNTPLTENTEIMLMIISPITFSIIASVYVKRLHDINLSGWWLLLLLAPVIALIINENANIFSNDTKNSIGAFILLYFLAISIMVCGRKGTTGDNRFGKDPLQKNKIN